MSDHGPPQLLRTTAILQLVSGLLNVFVMAAVMATALTLAGGGAGTLCLSMWCPVGIFGWACGAWGLLLLPIGVLEIVAGTAGLVVPDGAGTLMRVAGMAEVGSVLFGGVVSGLIGVVALNQLRDDEVVAWIEEQR